MMLKKHERGFTLIEVLLSVALISMLAGLSMPLYRTFQAKNDLDIATVTVAQISRRAQLLSQEIKSDMRFFLLKDASLWASTFAYIEWLTIFDIYKVFPRVDEVAVTLQKHWGWDKKIGRIFWKAGRHPYAHVGQTNSFFSYKNTEWNGLRTNVTFDTNISPEKHKAGWKLSPFIGVSIWPPVENPLNHETVHPIGFHHQIILSDLLPKLADEVAKKIFAERNEVNIETIVKLNKQILH